MSKNVFQFLFFVFLGGWILPVGGSVLNAQNAGYQVANRLYLQQRYEEAIPIYKGLVAANPQEPLYFEQYIDSYIQLKRYDEAINIAQKYIKEGNNTELASVRLGELYFFSGDTTSAVKTWFQNIERNSGNLQLYLMTARTMTDRKAFGKAIEVFELGRKRFGPNLFFFDIANTYMLAGEYEKALKEYIALIETTPDQYSAIQRNILRFRDPFLNDIAILEIQDRLENLPVDHQAYSSLHSLLIWLLQENKLYRRAVASAIQFERSTSYITYSLFNLGRQLVEHREFELAADAFGYYVDNGTRELRWRSTEELAKVHVKWANHLEDFGLNFNDRRDSLYTKADELLDEIKANAPTYSGLPNVLVLQAEIAIDFLYKPERAESFVEDLKEIAPNSKLPEIEYLQGRIELFKQNYPQARIHLTRSNKAASASELSEKTRYFLALTDFFNNEYEFAQIQLKALGRKNASYYANDALQLRMWLQQALKIELEEARAFAKAMEHKFLGNKNNARTLLGSISSDLMSTFSDDSAIALSEIAAKEQLLDLYTKIEAIINAPVRSPQRERLMWERAKIAEIISSNPTSGAVFDVANLYEELIVEYPQGFYASEARNRLTKMPKKQS